MTDRTSQTVRLEDGRDLGYAEYGAPGGKPAFYFHGFPLSRLDWPLGDPHDVASELGVRVLAVDRPGTGLSSFQPGRRLLDWPRDVVALADRLDIARFAVLGLSGGGPYAAACAFAIPERLTSATIVAGMGPADAPGAASGHAMTLPLKGRLLRRLLFALANAGLRRAPERVMLSLEYGAADAALLARPEVLAVAAEAMLEASRSGSRGPSWGAGLFRQPWGFDLQDIALPIALFHGEQDRNVPVSVARYVAARLSDCDPVFLPDDGHFTIAPNHIRRILAGAIA